MKPCPVLLLPWLALACASREPAPARSGDHATTATADPRPTPIGEPTPLEVAAASPAASPSPAEAPSHDAPSPGLSPSSSPSALQTAPPPAPSTPPPPRPVEARDLARPGPERVLYEVRRRVDACLGPERGVRTRVVLVLHPSGAVTTRSVGPAPPRVRACFAQALASARAEPFAPPALVVDAQVHPHPSHAGCGDCAATDALCRARLELRCGIDFEAHPVR